jgi:hypothetical protein
LQTGKNVSKLMARTNQKVFVIPIEHDQSVVWNEPVSTSELTNCYTGLTLTVRRYEFGCNELKYIQTCVLIGVIGVYWIYNGQYF